MARISWLSNSCAIPSGYGQQSAQVVHRMVQDGHEAAVIANHGATVMMNCSAGHPIFPEGLLRYSVDAAPDQMRGWVGDAGLSVILFDLWPLLPWSDSFNGLNLACWVPIDHDPIPEAVLNFVKADNRHAIAMSEFGERQLLKHLPRERVTFIPHAIDRKVFYDHGREAAREMKKQMGLPEDAHLTIQVAANRGRVPARKAFYQVFQGWWDFAKDKPDAYLYCHTEPLGLSEGVNLPRMMRAMGIDGERVRWPNPHALRAGIAPEQVAQLMSASDVMAAASYGEGFGVPTAEGQSTGTPAIVTGFSAQPELIGPHGHIVGGQLDWDEFQQSWWCVPSIPDITAALESNYADTKAGKIDRAAVAAAMARYDADTVYQERWKPLIAKLIAQPTIGKPNRAQRRAAK